MELVDVKCPFKYISKSDGKQYDCNRICVRVKPGSAGEAKCRFCRKSFEFEVSNQDSAVSHKLAAIGGTA